MHIALLGFLPDDGVSASLSCTVLWFLLKLKHIQTETIADPSRIGSDVQRFERQG